MTPFEYLTHCQRTWRQEQAVLSYENARRLDKVLSMAVPASMWAEWWKKFAAMGRTTVSQPADSSMPDEAVVWPLLAKRLPSAMRSLHALMGLLGEWHEVFACVPGERDKARDELGDMLYYLTILAHEHGLSLNEVMEHNVAKLQKRYPPTDEATAPVPKVVQSDLV